ncbi:hypothetical protein BG262_03000 [Floricoccus penangensis]|uniref:DUF985 domain-containing protein n=1 Tax=Floricoccus penangensis TaxID=1859475 RepID=A0A9Q5JGZ7_9LACT|nr:cupin domain-containing protein [Floricoccus penangensis]OFI46782.1 hypothetical protein BG262_03000 [Floricoccus penangensis]
MDKMTIDEIIFTLNLVPLVNEGGLVAQTYLSEETYENRRCGSAIYYFLTKDSFSHLHKLSADEIWHYYYGDTVEILQIDDKTGQHKISKLGTNLLDGETPQVLIRKNTWQGARIKNGGAFGYTLMGTTMSPSYMEKDFILGEQKEMLKRFPNISEEIKKFTGEKIYK